MNTYVRAVACLLLSVFLGKLSASSAIELWSWMSGYNMKIGLQRLSEWEGSVEYILFFIAGLFTFSFVGGWAYDVPDASKSCQASALPLTNPSAPCLAEQLNSQGEDADSTEEDLLTDVKTTVPTERFPLASKASDVPDASKSCQDSGLSHKNLSGPYSAEQLNCHEEENPDSIEKTDVRTNVPTERFRTEHEAIAAHTHTDGWVYKDVKGPSLAEQLNCQEEGADSIEGDLVTDVRRNVPTERFPLTNEAIAAHIHTDDMLHEDAKETSGWTKLIRPETPPGTPTLPPSLLDSQDLFAEWANALPDIFTPSAEALDSLASDIVSSSPASTRPIRRVLSATSSKSSKLPEEMPLEGGSVKKLRRRWEWDRFHQVADRRASGLERGAVKRYRNHFAWARSPPVNERPTFVPGSDAAERPANFPELTLLSPVKGQQTSFTARGVDERPVNPFEIAIPSLFEGQPGLFITRGVDERLANPLEMGFNSLVNGQQTSRERERDPSASIPEAYSLASQPTDFIYSDGRERENIESHSKGFVLDSQSPTDFLHSKGPGREASDSTQKGYNPQTSSAATDEDERLKRRRNRGSRTM